MIIDISPPLSVSTAVWPGDTPLSREILLEIARGASVTLSTLRATVHLGAHADAPSHYGDRASDIATRALGYYIGACEVMRVPVARGGVITPAMLPRAASAPRVLFATGTAPDPAVFNTDFAALSPELVDHLHATGVILAGIDTPSVDPFSSKELAAHKRFLANDMANLEGLVLDGVEEGHYELIALPLRLEGFDASPVRAVLRSSRSP
jgi:arylformamidase